MTEHSRPVEMAARIREPQDAALKAENAVKVLMIERDALTAQVARLRRAIMEARAEHEARIEDIVILTTKYESVREEAEKAACQQLAEVTAHRDALLASTSWKITSPLRKVISVMRRR